MDTINADVEINGLSSGSEIDLVASANLDGQEHATFARGEGHANDVAKTQGQGHQEQKVKGSRSRPKSSRVRRPPPLQDNPPSPQVPRELPPRAVTPDAELSQQIQQAVVALQEYQKRLKTPQPSAGVPDSEEAEDLRRTLGKMTQLCDACLSSSAALSLQLSAARQLTENINQELSLKLEATDLNDWIPPGSYREEEKSLPEQKQAAQRERLARAAEARAAVARASYVMQSKTQELARAESAMAEAELAAAAAKEVAEEAVEQMEATRAAEEAKRKQELEEEEEEARRMKEEKEKKEEEEGEEARRKNEEDKAPRKEEEEEEEVKRKEEEAMGDAERIVEGLQENAGEGGQTTQHGEDYTAHQQPIEESHERAEMLPEDSAKAGNHAHENDAEQRAIGQNHFQPEDSCTATDFHQQREKEEKELDRTTMQNGDKEQEPELTSQKVFEEVHVVHESVDGGRYGGDDGDCDDFVDSRDLEHTKSQWPRYIYSLDPGDWDTGLGCVVRAPARSVARDDIEVTRVHPASADLRLHDSEELVSNIIDITPCGHLEGKKFSPFISVSLPHCAPRMHPGREPVVRMRPLRGGGWRDLPTSDVFFDDIREHKFVEAHVREPGTLCVVLRLKREEVQVTRFGGKAMSSADSRVTLTWPPNVVKATADLTMATQFIDQAVVSELRSRTDTDCGNLMSSSPVLHMQSKGTKLLLPLTISLPCPPNPAVKAVQRPATSVQRRPARADSLSGDGGDQRPVSARPFFTAAKKAEEIHEDVVHVLWRREGGTWSQLQDVKFQQSKKKDIVVFELREPLSRILLLRTRTGLSQAAVERIASTLEHMAAHHPAHLVLRQHSKDPSQVILTYTNDAIMERSMRHLADEGYTEGPPLSAEVKLREGQSLEIGFRGNIEPEQAEFLPRCVFYNNIPFRVQFCVQEIDRFAQKGFDTYRGFVQLSATYNAPFRRTSSASGMFGMQGNNGHGPPACFVTGKHLLTELMVNIPKPEPEPPKPLNTAPVQLKSYGPVTNDLLRHVAQQLAADDWKRLAPMLNVRRTRLQAILRQNVSSPAWVPIYDVLLTWSKRLPQAFDRVEMLCAALTAVGRQDLAEVVQDQAENFRHEHFVSTRETLLNKAFIRIARHEKAVAQWRRLALFLGLSEEEVGDVTNRTSSARERCIQSLQRWKENQDQSGEMSTVTLLSRKLRLCRFRALAKDIDSIR